jgi:hypothetical protein
LTPSSTLDLNDSDFILDYSGSPQLAMIQALINTARADGAWTGPGLGSSSARFNSAGNTTLGAIEATSYKSVYGNGATFKGEAIDSTAILVKYTYYGDTDFNGFVDGDDYARADHGYNFNEGGWFNGDADGNGIIDGDDYSLIDNAYNTQAATL